MKDKDWKSFVDFATKNLVKSFIINRSFNEFWFRRKNGTWSVQLAKKNGEIVAINMLIETQGKICGTVAPFIWTSTAYANHEARKQGVVGLMLFNVHRNSPLVGSACANKKSLIINNELGSGIPNLKMRRFIYIYNLKCLKIVKKKHQTTIKKNLKFIKYNANKKVLIRWSKNIPNDIEKLWSIFSKNFECCIQKNLNYLNKRYVKSPFQEYDILTFRNKSNSLLGVSIIRFQKTPLGICSRIVDFMSLPTYEFDIWQETLKECESKNSIFTDFIVMGTSQDKHILNAGFQLATKKNNFDEIPNLLSPIEYRKWSYTFHLSGYLPKKLKNWRHGDRIWFTKGDGDRDWPTPYDLNNLNLN